MGVFQRRTADNEHDQVVPVTRAAQAEAPNDAGSSSGLGEQTNVHSTMPGSEKPDVEPAPPVDQPRFQGWPSNRAIVVGDPTPTFESKAVSTAFRTTPYRPDTIIDGWSSGPFTVRAASMRGHLHRYNGAPRQDDFAITLKPDQNRLIVAVADGVSAAVHSHIGASAVVRYATQWLADMAPDRIEDTDWRPLLQSAAWTLIEQAGSVLGSDDVDARQAETALATTLSCSVCEPLAGGGLSVHLVGVGDSGAWILGGDGTFTQVLGGKPASEAGVTSSAVSGLPRVPNTVEAIEATVKPDEVLLVGTDGIGDPLGDGTGDVAALFRAVLAHRVPSLIEFAHALDFSRETFDDDRTLVALWPRSQYSSNKPA